MSLPSLSIIIPSFNQGIYIERTILSILRQNYPGELQVIVSDGGSTDSTLEVLKKYPQLQWWSAPDKGFVDAVTKGLAAATGEIIAIQSSDDFYLKDAFSKAIPVLVEEPRLGFVSGADIRVGPAPGQLAFNRHGYATLISPGAVFFDNLDLHQHCTFLRRQAIDRVGGLSAGADRCADTDLWYRILHFYPGRVLPDYLGGYQLHNEQRTKNRADLWLASYRYMVESCEADPNYSAKYKMTPAVKELFFKSFEIIYLESSGGPTGHEASIKVARDVVSHADRWDPTVVAFAKSHLSKTTRMGRSISNMKRNNWIRKCIGKPPLNLSPPVPVDPSTVLWWK